VADSPDGGHVYVTNQHTGKVSVIDTATNTVITTVSVGSSQYEVAVSADGGRAYVTNYGSGSVSVLSIVPTGP